MTFQHLNNIVAFIVTHRLPLGHITFCTKEEFDRDWQFIKPHGGIDGIGASGITGPGQVEIGISTAIAHTFVQYSNIKFYFIDPETLS